MITEKLRPFGREGHHALKKLFQEAGVPPWRRGQYPLLWDDIGLFCIPQIWQRANTQLSGDERLQYCAVQWRSKSPELFR